MITCSKELTLTVKSGGPPKPDFYWPMASIVAGKTPDIIGGKDMTVGGVFFNGAGFQWDPAGGTNQVVTGLITNALSFPSSNRHPPSFEIDVLESPALGMVPNQSFTMRAWTKDPTSLAVQMNNIFAINPADTNPNNVGHPFAQTDDCMVWMLQDVPYSQQIMDFSADDPNTATWHRLLVGWNQSTGSMFGKVDNLTTHTQVNPDGLHMTALDFMMLYCNGFTALVCEFAIWKGVVLTEPQMLFDWNGGAGKTWPW